MRGQGATAPVRAGRAVRARPAQERRPLAGIAAAGRETHEPHRPHSTCPNGDGKTPLVPARPAVRGLRRHRSGPGHRWGPSLGVSPAGRAMPAWRLAQFSRWGFLTARLTNSSAAQHLSKRGRRNAPGAGASGRTGSSPSPIGSGTEVGTRSGSFARCAADASLEAGAPCAPGLRSPANIPPLLAGRAVSSVGRALAF